MMTKSKIWVFIYMFSCTYGQVCRDSCRESRIQGLRSVDCYDQKLREVPDCLSSNIEILDLSLNRIREITEADLKKYSYIKILYLTDNVITTISEEGLRDKTDLHTLDISYNVLFKIPRVIFQLPSLRKLYMSHVESPHMVEDIENSSPVESPLVYLDLSYNKLRRLPNLGIVPSLVTYNISGNANLRINASDFAGLCNLQVLANECISARFDNPCECWKTEMWLKERNVTFSSFNCHAVECSLSSEDLEVYNNCRILHEGQMLRSFVSKLLINVSIGASIIIVLLFVVLYYIMRRKKQRKKARNNQSHSTSPINKDNQDLI